MKQIIFAIIFGLPVLAAAEGQEHLRLSQIGAGSTINIIRPIEIDPGGNFDASYVIRGTNNDGVEAFCSIFLREPSARRRVVPSIAIVVSRSESMDQIGRVALNTESSRGIKYIICGKDVYPHQEITVGEVNQILGDTITITPAQPQDVEVTGSSTIAR